MTAYNRQQLNHVWYERLKFCGCGCPEDVMRLLHDGLSILIAGQLVSRAEVPFDTYWPRREALTKACLGKAEYLVWYLLDNLGFTEHGGSVPGWPDGDAEAFVNGLRKHGFSDWGDYDALGMRYDVPENAAACPGCDGEPREPFMCKRVSEAYGEKRKCACCDDCRAVCQRLEDD